MYFRHHEACALLRDPDDIKPYAKNLAIKNRHLLRRWFRGALVMQDKSQGSTNTQKLRAILLLEDNFNAI